MAVRRSMLKTARARRRSGRRGREAAPANLMEAARPGKRVSKARKRRDGISQRKMRKTKSAVAWITAASWVRTRVDQVA